MKKILTTLLIFITLNSFSQIQPKDTATYFLLGKHADFELLFKAVTDHDNVTPNQIKALAEWINKIQPIVADKPKQK